MESKSRLKQRLARLFQSSTAPLLRAPCNHSATSRSIFSSSSAAGSTSSRRSASTDIVVDPVFLVRRNGATSSSTPPPPPFLTGKVDRSLSLPLSLPAGLDCGGCRPAARTASERDLAKNIHHKKKKDYGAAGVAEGNACPPASPSSRKKIQLRSVNNRADQDQKNKTPTPTAKKKKSRRKKKLLSNGYGFSSSSSSEEFEFSSSDDHDDDEEADSNFFSSSRSFSSDSSGFYRRPSSNRTKKKKEKEKKKLSGRPPRHSRDGFQPVISVVPSKKKVEEEEEEEEKSGFPVTKRSKDPYADFRDSMVEMIVERQMFGAKDLEQLLRSYLSLNSPHHHPVILRAFADISEVLFGH
ncbi:transcription repressor OFP7-like [Iris pallida]|uniref:Transcription repressor n=1 Tax=Iris pallida TaxID=29817 RepID=A0AAX6FPT1_IRIPA|nr:transcription repressor OFP7-like [Iris pallida]